jgi:hypothetical protein
MHVSTRGNTCRGRLFLNLVGIWLPLNPFQQHRVFQLLLDNTSSAESLLLHQHFRWPAFLPAHWPNAASMFCIRVTSLRHALPADSIGVAGPTAPSHLRVLRSVRLIGLKRERITEKSIKLSRLFLESSVTYHRRSPNFSACYVVDCGDRNRQCRVRLVKRSIRFGPTLQDVSATPWTFFLKL